ncbi:hypothetical protein ACNKHT_06825 [Shigella flexneri]
MPVNGKAAPCRPRRSIELDDFAELQKEVFGPVLHVVRYNRNQLPELIEQINASGYRLTLVSIRVLMKPSPGRSLAMLVTCMLTVIWWAQWWVCRHSAAKGCPVPGDQAVRSISTRLLANRPESALAVTLRASGCEYPVDAQLKAALTQPLNALREWAAKSSRIAGVMSPDGRRAGRNTTIAAGPTGERDAATLLPREHVLCICR